MRKITEFQYISLRVKVHKLLTSSKRGPPAIGGTREVGVWPMWGGSVADGGGNVALEEWECGRWGWECDL